MMSDENSGNCKPVTFAQEMRRGLSIAGAYGKRLEAENERLRGVINNRDRWLSLFDNGAAIESLVDANGELIGHLAASQQEVERLKQELEDSYRADDEIQEIIAADEDELKAEVERLRGEVEFLKDDRKHYTQEYLESYVGQLERQLAAQSALIAECRGMLEQDEWVPSEDSCENIEHEETDLDGEHYHLCRTCGRFQCEGHKPDCKRVALIEKLAKGEK